MQIPRSHRQDDHLSVAGRLFLRCHMRTCIQYPPQKLRGRQADESYDLDGAEDISPGSGKRGTER